MIDGFFKFPFEYGKGFSIERLVLESHFFQPDEIRGFDVGFVAFRQSVAGLLICAHLARGNQILDGLVQISLGGFEGSEITVWHRESHFIELP